MRILSLCLLLLFVASVTCVAADETIAGLKARADNARPEERPDLCVRVAEHQLHNADKLYNEGHVAEARAAVEDISTYSEKARDAAIQSKKHLKNVEIDVRKMSARLGDLKRTLAVEDQPPVEQAIRRLEDVRTALLKEMFSNKKDKK